MDKAANDWNVYGHLRATIATAALQGVLANPQTNKEHMLSIFSEHVPAADQCIIAKRCVQMADALIAELAKGGGK